jgi:hypothetical protein
MDEFKQTKRGFRNSNGNVPNVNWNSNNSKLNVNWYNVDNRNDNLRTREVIYDKSRSLFGI